MKQKLYIFIKKLIQLRNLNINDGKPLEFGLSTKSTGLMLACKNGGPSTQSNNNTQIV
jgi:hypothetical protein